MREPAPPSIRSVRHAGAVAEPGRCPVLGIPEIALAGRSNVGKSSLLNALLGRRPVARVSSRPGCTRLLHFYVVNDALALVDLPGYGYAAVSREERAGYKRLVEGYLRRRRELCAVLLVVDVRRDPGEEERALREWLEDAGIPIVVVATKCDKVSKAALHGRLRAVGASLGGGVPVAFSAATPLGRGRLWREILERLPEEGRASFAKGDA